MARHLSFEPRKWIQTKYWKLENAEVVHSDWEKSFGNQPASRFKEKCRIVMNCNVVGQLMLLLVTETFKKKPKK